MVGPYLNSPTQDVSIHSEAAKATGHYTEAQIAALKGQRGSAGPRTAIMSLRRGRRHLSGCKMMLHSSFYIVVVVVVVVIVVVVVVVVVAVFTSPLKYENQRKVGPIVL